MRTPAIALLVAASALGACSAGPTASEQVSSQRPSGQLPSNTPRPTQAAGPERIFTGIVPVGSGRVLEAECWGSGSPTIVLEAGATRSNLDDWDYGFLMRLAEANTVCRYSRAGGGGSTPPEDLLTYELVIGDAFTLLDWLREEHEVNPPYVFVGWSFGGAVALAEALERPEETAGIVILDTDPLSTVDFMTQCTGSGRAEADCRAEYDGDLEAQQLGEEIRTRMRPLPDLPAAIVSALVFPDCHLEPGESTVAYNINGSDVTAPDCEELASRVADIHADGWAEILPQMTQTRVSASHDDLTTQASGTLVEVIQDVIARAAAAD
jgi:pimeloyl-ACP methyl ester carboxylesterase